MHRERLPTAEQPHRSKTTGVFNTRVMALTGGLKRQWRYASSSKDWPDTTYPAFDDFGSTI
jgi:hypothetical protein